MATASALFNGGQYRAELTANASGTSITASLIVRKLSGSGYWTLSSEPYGLEIAGVGYDGSWTYDFRGATTQTVRGNTTRSGLNPGSSYIVAAWVEMGSPMGRTAVFQVSLTIQTPPDATTNGSISNHQETGLTYSFTRGDGNGSALTANQVQYSLQSNFSNATTVNLGAGTASAAVSNLLSGRRYYFRSRSQNAMGWGPWGASANAMTRPAAPTGGSFSSVTTSAMTLSISPPTGASYYEFQWGTSPGSTAGGGAVAPVGGTSHRATGLQPGRTYYWRVRAYNSEDRVGAWSANWSQVTLPSVPTDRSLDNITASSMRYSFSAPSGATGHQVQYGTASNFSNATTVSLGAGSTSLTRTGLSAGTTYYWRVRSQTAAGWGSWSSGSGASTLPPSPLPGSVGSPTTSSLRFSFSSGGGAAPTDWQSAISTSPTFATTLATQNGSSPRTFTGLDPAKTYYFRVRAQNASGYGAWSSIVSGTTLPSSPPALVIAASPSGTSATARVTPPSGASGVTEYRVEYRLTGSSTWTVLTGTSASRTISGLTPGASYQWRSSVTFQGYTSPYSPIQTTVQPKPLTSPGEYFDGNTASTTDVDFVWTGAVNNSISEARAVVPQGWGAFESGAGVSGGTGAVYRIAGGRFGTYSARVTFFSATQTDGFTAGLALMDPGSIVVQQSADYVGSIYVQVEGRSQRLAAALVWTNNAGDVISTSLGDGVLVAADAWARLSVVGSTPVGATRVSVRVIDVTGTGWSTWKGGDTFILDGAMISVGTLFPYFDGDTRSSAEYAYEWLGAANASASRRALVSSSATDPLRDPDCAVVPAPPRPPVVLDDCIDDVSIWRRYWTAIPITQVSDWLDDIPTFILTTGNVSASQVRIRIFPNPSNLPPEFIDENSYISEQAISYVPPNTELTIDGRLQRVFAEVNGRAAIPADHLLYGSDGSPATWPVLSCGQAYQVAVDVPLESDPGNLATPQIKLTRRM